MPKRKNQTDNIQEVVSRSIKENKLVAKKEDESLSSKHIEADSLYKKPDSDVVSSGNELTVYTGKIDSTDPFHQYLREISKYPLLSIEKERELIKSLNETGDIEIAKKLVMANLRLVVKIAMEYRSTWQNVMDLIQEGNIGLMKAVSKYDDAKGAKLSYYASWWIKSYILKFILDNFRMVKIGTTNEQKKLFYNLMREKNRLLSMGVTPDQKAISESLGVSEKAVELMDKRLNYGGEVSFDAPVRSGNDSTGSTVGELIADDKAVSIESDVSSRQELGLLKNHLGGFMDSLKPRDREIFQNRLLREAPLSLQEIGDLYGVSRERIRQVEARLIQKLKVYMSEFIR